jgi:hypothetical protein
VAGFRSEPESQSRIRVVRVARSDPSPGPEQDPGRPTERLRLEFGWQFGTRAGLAQASQLVGASGGRRGGPARAALFHRPAADSDHATGTRAGAPDPARGPGRPVMTVVSPAARTGVTELSDPVGL